MKTLFELTNPAPNQEDYPDLESWAKAHRDWKCQKQGWTYGSFAKFTQNIDIS
jgi:hypothetical protein